MARREEEFLDQREEFYNSRKAYRKTIKDRHKARRPDYRSYVPSPEDIQRRAADLHWLQTYDVFPEKFLRAVMHFNKPPIQRVVYLMQVMEYTPLEVLKEFGFEPRKKSTKKGRKKKQ